MAKANAETGKTKDEEREDEQRGILQELTDSVSALTVQVAALTENQGKTNEKVKKGEGLLENLFGPLFGEKREAG